MDFPEVTNNHNKLALFNLSMETSNFALSNNRVWAFELSRHFSFTLIQTTRGSDLPKWPNSEIRALGGGSLQKRAIAIFRLSINALRIIANRSNYVVFHHQSPRTVVFPGILFKLFRVPQGLWYSHSAKPISLKLAVNIADFLVTSSENSCGLRAKRNYFLGHGIEIAQAKSVFLKSSNRFADRQGIVFLGRIAPIKNLEECLKAVSLCDSPQVPITFIGRTEESRNYAEALEKIAKTLRVNLSIRDAIPHSAIFGELIKFKFFYSGMKNSVDKSSLEAAACGCFVVSMNSDTLFLSGMQEFVLPRDAEKTFTIDQQLDYINSKTIEQQNQWVNNFQEYTCANNDVAQTTLKIASILKELKRK